MNCLSCGKEMVKGYIPFYQGRLYWSPINKIPWNVYSLPKGSVVLSELAYIKPRTIEAFYCNTCKIIKIVVDEKIKQPKLR